MKTRNFPGRKNTRRVAALARIEEQIALDTKPMKRTHPFHRRRLSLSVDEALRLRRERDKLQSIIVTDEQARAVRTKKIKALGWSPARTAYRSGRLG